MLTVSKKVKVSVIILEMFCFSLVTNSQENKNKELHEANKKIFELEKNEEKRKKETAQHAANSIPDTDCKDYPSQQMAQNFYDSMGQNNAHGLDRDLDGIACESFNYK